MPSLQPLLERDKIAYLPDDLRSVAESMLRERFGEPETTQDDGVLSLEYLQRVMADAQEKMIQPNVFIVPPKFHHQLQKMAQRQYEASTHPMLACDFGFKEDSMATIFGTKVKVSNTIDKHTIILKTRNYGKSDPYKRVFEQPLGYIESKNEAGDIIARLGELDADS